jgi:undecaprenyl-diphosphatase
MDEKLLLLINQDFTSPGLDRFMAAMSAFDLWAPLLALAVVGLLWRGSFRVRAFVLTAGLLVGVNDGVIARNLKRAADRPRPHQSHFDVRTVELARAKPRLLALAKPVRVKRSSPAEEEIEGRSFPSSHTMNTLTAALVAAAFFGAKAWPAFLVAGIVGYSRIYTGSHWPSDVAVSIVLGTGTTLLMLAALEMAWRRLGAKAWPRLHAEHSTLFAAR